MHAITEKLKEQKMEKLNKKNKTPYEEMTRKIYLQNFTDDQIKTIKTQLPEWLDLHVDFDNEISILIKSHGKDKNTPFCNPPCNYCYSLQLPKKIKDKLINQKEKIPEDILNNENLKENIILAKKISKELKLPLRLYTSGKGLNKNTLNFILNNVDILEISLNSPIAQTRAKMMRTSIEQAKREITMLREIKQKSKVYLNNVITQENLKEINQILEFGKPFEKNILIPFAKTKWSKEKALTKPQRRTIIKESRKYKNVILSPSFFSQLFEYKNMMLDGMKIDYVPKKKYLIISTPCFGFIIQEVAQLFGQKYLEVKSSLGGNINVAGLLLGSDLIKTIKNKKIDLRKFDYILLPYISLENNSLLDGYTLNKLSLILNTRVIQAPKSYFELNDFFKNLEQ